MYPNGLTNIDSHKLLYFILFGVNFLQVGKSSIFTCKYLSYLRYSSFPQAVELYKINPENINMFLDGIYNTVLFKDAMQRKGITDKNYITNSYHVPVFEEIDAFTKLKLESEFQNLSPGGAISYIETSNLTNNLDAVMEVIRFIYDNIMYAELNTKSDYCHECGFDGEILVDDNLEWYCPNCGNRDHDKLNVARRTCGYIGTNFWNKGRTQEIKERVIHLDNKDTEEC